MIGLTDAKMLNQKYFQLMGCIARRRGPSWRGLRCGAGGQRSCDQRLRSRDDAPGASKESGPGVK